MKGEADTKDPFPVPSSLRDISITNTYTHQNLLFVVEKCNPFFNPLSISMAESTSCLLSTDFPLLSQMKQQPPILVSTSQSSLPHREVWPYDCINSGQSYKQRSTGFWEFSLHETGWSFFLFFSIYTWNMDMRPHFSKSPVRLIQYSAFILVCQQQQTQMRPPSVLKHYFYLFIYFAVWKSIIS